MPARILLRRREQLTQDLIHTCKLQQRRKQSGPASKRVRSARFPAFGALTMAKARRGSARPAAGHGGEQRSEMRHQVTARMSDADYALLRALAAALQTSQADVITRGLMALTETLPADTRTVLRLLRRQRQG